MKLRFNSLLRKELRDTRASCIMVLSRKPWDRRPAMHRRISTIRQLRQDLAAKLDENFIHDACRQAGHRGATVS